MRALVSMVGGMTGVLPWWAGCSVFTARANSRTLL
jgi:hypothetical protein